MSLAIKYENVEDAMMRLRNSVVLYKGFPVLITDVQRGEGDDKLRVLFTKLPSKRAGEPRPKFDPFFPEGNAFPEGKDKEADKRKYISSKYFDIAPFKLGYVNDKKLGAFYCSRLPNRIQKQGLCAENFSAKLADGRAIPFGTFCACPDLPAMVAGNYPSPDQALRLLDESPSVAFARDYALVRDTVIPALIYLYHKGKKVGMYSHGEISLGKNFNCLKESLNEMKLKVA